jgi:hypothetical protein
MLVDCAVSFLHPKSIFKYHPISNPTDASGECLASRKSISIKGFAATATGGIALSQNIVELSIQALK